MLKITREEGVSNCDLREILLRSSISKGNLFRGKASIERHLQDGTYARLNLQMCYCCYYYYYFFFFHKEKSYPARESIIKGN